jgi:hypothetical protein
VCKAAVEVSRLLSRCRGRRRSVEAAVEVLRPLSKCRAAVEVLRLLSRSRLQCIEAAIEVEAEHKKGR